MYCENCGKEMTMVQQTGAMEAWECPSCGNKQTTLATYIDDGFPERSPPPVKLNVRWQTMPPSPAEIAALRSAFPHFANVPVKDFLKAARQAALFAIGTFERAEAKQIVEEARRLGLDVVIED
jgi:hypothetical protein